MSPLNCIQHYYKTKRPSLCFEMGLKGLNSLYIALQLFYLLIKNIHILQLTHDNSFKPLAKLVLQYIALLLRISNLCFLKYSLVTLRLSYSLSHFKETELAENRAKRLTKKPAKLSKKSTKLPVFTGAKRRGTLKPAMPPGKENVAPESSSADKGIVKIILDYLIFF